MNTRVSAFDTNTIVDDGEDITLSTSRFSVDSVMQSVRNFATLSEALRLLGAGVILASMSVFLLQGWNAGNDISRYLLLLTQTGSCVCVRYIPGRQANWSTGFPVLPGVPTHFRLFTVKRP